MSYPRNAASPPQLSIGPVVQISDGAVQTSGCTVRIIPEGAAEGDGGGTTSYSTDGVVCYVPTQAETNYTAFILIAKKTGCIPASISVVTGASAVAGRVMPADGSITAAVIADGAIDNATFAADVGSTAYATNILALAADKAILNANLDHVAGTATGIPALPAGTWLDSLRSDGTATYDRTTDSLQAIRDTTGLASELAKVVSVIEVIP